MSVPPNPESILQPARVLPFAYPLDEFYALANRELPPIEKVDATSIPQPWRGLLVHNDDMTPTLEQFHRRKLYLNVITRHHRGDSYFREVILLTERRCRPVEFGAIKINLALFPCAARAMILAEQKPLGSILAQFKIPHSSRPKAFLRVQADQFVKAALQLSGEHLLYARRNTLFDAEQRPLAEIVEILPPADQP
jgi:hypothetical protein